MVLSLSYLRGSELRFYSASTTGASLSYLRGSEPLGVLLIVAAL